MLVKLV